jgi:tetratricopeptide (TPR) repeat protein
VTAARFRSPGARSDAGIYVLALLVCLVSGCATGHPLEAPQPPGAAARSIPRAEAASTAAPTSDLPTIEARDARLGAALTALAAHATAEAHRRVAAEYSRLRVFDCAYDQLKSALRLAPHDAATFDGLARIWRDWGFPELGLGDAYRAIYYAPKSPEFQNTLGTVLYALGDTREAERRFALAHALDPGAAYALSNLCYLSVTRGTAEQGLDDCRRAVTLAPAFTSARNNLALAYAALGHDDWAEREFLQAGDRAAGHFNMGVLHMAHGEYAQAAVAFGAACRERPLLEGACDRAQQASQLAKK